VNETSAVILSSGRLVRRRRGGPAHVDVDWRWTLRREETKGDVAGFYHTHPEGFLSMSDRDRRTMRAWAICFGKPLVAVIRCGRRVSGWMCDGRGAEDAVGGIKVKDGVVTWKR
jgi:hypothetical protein